jgi:hypothetical protein
MRFAHQVNREPRPAPGDFVGVVIGDETRYGIAVNDIDTPGSTVLALILLEDPPQLSLRAIEDFPQLLNFGQQVRLSLDDLRTPHSSHLKKPFILGSGQTLGLYMNALQGVRGTDVRIIDCSDWTIKTVRIDPCQPVKHFGWSAWIAEEDGGEGSARPLIVIAL